MSDLESFEDYKEDPATDTVVQGPPKGYKRVFWLMQSLKESMSSGAWITPTLYVSPSVWLV